MENLNAIHAIRAQAHLHHAYLLGLQLMVSTRKGPDVMGEWMFRLFRRQHLDKFLSSFEKLGVKGLPDAVACAQYHVLSNNIGGVGVEYMYESDSKAWVRFRYPRWMYHGPTICGVPVEVSRGFLKGWYAHNGVSLGNPRLGFVCVSEDMTGEFGFCGYFKEYGHDLSEDERLQFAKGEVPPPYVEADQPKPPPTEWNEARLEKANRNYALDYIRNGLCELMGVLGAEETAELATLSARLIGLQYFQETAAMIGVREEEAGAAQTYLAHMLRGMGDEVTVDEDGCLTQSGLRIVRGMQGAERALLLQAWVALWQGALQSMRLRPDLQATIQDNNIIWTIGDRA